MLRQFVDQFVDYVSRDDTRAVLETKILTPVMRWCGERVRWCVWTLQIVVLLVVVQTVILLWLLLRELRRPPVIC